MTRMILLLLLFVALPSISGWSLNLSPSEERIQNRRSGENFLVVCKVKDFDGAASDVKIEWYREDKLVPRFGSTMTIERPYSSQLMINRPKIADGGKYTCKTEINGEKQEVLADISFVDPPKFVNIKEEQHPEEGTRAEIVCEVEGTDQLEVFWQFNGVTLDETSQRKYEFSENNQILYIPHFTAKKDDGIYNCNAAQYSSFETLSVNVSGYARPTITVFDVPHGNNGIEGHTIELKCGAVGKPKPSYKWFFEDDEVPIARSDKHNVEEGLLIIESLNSEDAGTYKCIANNTVGTNERSFELAVYLKPKVELKHEHVIKEGEDIEIVCSYHGDGYVTAKFVSGSREFTVNRETDIQSDEVGNGIEEKSSAISAENTYSEEVSTQKEEELVLRTSTEEVDNAEEKKEQQEEQTEINKWKRFTEDINSERISVRDEENKLILTIKRIALEDAGEYNCVASNEAGLTTRTTNVGIIHSPQLRHYTGPQVRSFEGNTLSIYCDVSAVPSPKWHWFKDGKEVEANGASIKIDTQTSSTKLTLETFEGNDNYGNYSCKADNGIGQLEKQISVIEIVKPATPVGMDCKKIIYPNFGRCSFDMEIYESESSMPQTMEVLIAKLEEMESDYNWSHARHITVRFKNITHIPDLEANVQYVIKIRAVNEAGSSEYTDEISLETTDPWAPQSPPSVKMECSEYCNVLWEAPNDHGSPLLKYKILVQEMQTKKHQSESEIESADSKSVSAELPTHHSIVQDDVPEVRGNEETTTEEEKGGNSEENKDNEEQKDEFSAEVLPTDSPISAEENESDTEDEKIPFGSPIIIEVDASDNEVQLTNVKPHSYYKISVAAVNAIGQGEPLEIEHQTYESPSKYDKGMDTIQLITLVAIGVFFLLFLVDLGCFLTNRCGLISCICLNLCGKNPNSKQRDLESGRDGPESNRLLGSSGAR
ncbi:unnamed protein product [Caenorhabditis sp. 36 PRJEB53466]|nr:unnamed protein product [Caenorhabditis sp. 36 PRJEB53466]